MLREEGKEVKTYLVGRKARRTTISVTAPSSACGPVVLDAPEFETAREIGKTLLDDFNTAYEDGGVDEIHIVFTRFKSMVVQEPAVIRLLPLEVVEEEAPSESDILPLYEYEPEPEQVLDALLPRYIESRIFAAMLQAAASELAARQRAMKSAGTTPPTLFKKYTRLRNNARQAEITQELSEIVAGADALSAS